MVALLVVTVLISVFLYVFIQRVTSKHYWKGEKSITFWIGSLGVIGLIMAVTVAYQVVTI